MQTPSPTQSGPGPFVTKRVRVLPDGRRLVHTSRRHRKRLAPLVISPDGGVRASDGRAGGMHLFAPRLLGWWIAVLFLIGSALFVLGAYLSNWPPAATAWLARSATINSIFFAGSVFFTSAGALQFLEAVNGDLTDTGARTWRWFAWRPRNLGYCASAIQLLGTVLFNFNTADSMIAGLSADDADVLVWAPDALGCVCFLAASVLAYVEYGHGRLAIAPRDVAWWIVSINTVGSVLFAASAALTFRGAEPTSANALFESNNYTLLGAACFFVASYLLIPELFAGPASDTSVSSSHG